MRKSASRLGQFCAVEIQASKLRIGFPFYERLNSRLRELDECDPKTAQALSHGQIQIPRMCRRERSTITPATDPMVKIPSTLEPIASAASFLAPKKTRQIRS
jgi:hypothetical protein